VVRPQADGLGFVPVAPEGWAVTLVAVVVAVCVAALTHDRWVALVMVVALLAIVFLKGTSPGGAREWEEYQAKKDRRDT
jgi:cell division protein FtsW (lipid II flippase)